MKQIFRISKVAQRTLWGALSTFVLLFAGIQEARASHFAAADIDVRFIGAQPQQGFCGTFETEFRYQVTIRIYKACEGSVPLPNTADYTVRSPSGFNSDTISRSAPLISEEILDQLCAQFKDQNACLLGGRPAGYPYPGFIRNTYVDIVSLPTLAPDWTFEWSGNARNAGIDNLQNPQSDLYVSCMVNSIVDSTNSSPRFTEDPIPFICVNKPAFFLNGPTDVDGDSIVVVPKAAESGYQTYYTYVPGFSAANPVGSPASDPYTVSPRTGTTTFLGPAQGKYVLAFRANEYNSSGVLIGYSDRDVQVSVLACTIAAPTLDPSPVDISGGIILNADSNNNEISICSGNELKMTFNGTSSTVGAILKISSNKDVAAPGATFDITGQETDVVKGEFKWTPTKNDIGPHTLIITLADSSCINGQSILQKKSTVVSIIVPGDADAGPDGFYCPDPNSTPFKIKGYLPTLTNFRWETVPGGSSVATLSTPDSLQPEARPQVPTQYVLVADSTPFICKLRDTVFVNTNNVRITQGPEQVLCRPGTLGLDAVVNGLPPRQIITCGGTAVANCTFTGPNATGDSATIGNCTNAASGAFNTDTLNPFHTYYATQKTQILYRKEDLRISGMLPQTLKRVAFYVDATNSGTPLNNFNIAMKCTQRQNMSVQGSLNYENNTTNVFSSITPISLVVGWNYFDLNKDFNYDTSQNLLVEICFANQSSDFQPGPVARYSPTNYVSILQRSASSGNVCNNSATGSAFESASNRPNIRLFGCRPNDLPFIYRWTPGDFLIDSFVANTSAYVPQSIKYYVELEGIEGCKVRDSIQIIVPTDTITVSPMDSLICPGELAIIEATKSPYQRYQWYEGDFQRATTLNCDTCQRVLARPKVDTRYTVIGSITYGILSRKACPDTSFADVRVREPAIIKVNPEDTLIKSGQRVILSAIGGDQYTWTPRSAGLNSNRGPRVTAQPQETTMFIVEGLDTNGCRGKDTANVRIDYRQTLFVPTAFTPNNDGNNDVFGVVNLSVQKIIEFRVFNRWGQEIFSTTDPRQGWDGTWKSTPQPSGIYNYIIRVAYPDGLTDTFKGDVTLIR